MEFLIVYIIGVLISGTICAVLLCKSDQDVTKRDVGVLAITTLLSFVGLILMGVTVIDMWYTEHGDEVVIKKSKDNKEEET